MSEKRLCPFAALGTARCDKNCALWLEEYDECAIKVIAKSLDSIARSLDNISRILALDLLQKR